MEEEKVPKTFISYSWDSEEHKEKMLQLAESLREAGVDCALDQFETSPEEGWAKWMINQVNEADYVLMVCTETYHRRATGHEEEGKGKGVTWEGAVITNLVYNSNSKNNKFIPVLFNIEDQKYIPIFLGSNTFYVLNKFDFEDNGYERCYRHITQQPEVVKKPLGKKIILPKRK
ncbi:MAG: TIR domain-containing protein [Leptospiraceae bacterium]|nr:TIR domain-containing protein [Leptospiraceae bacterium]